LEGLLEWAVPLQQSAISSLPSASPIPYRRQNAGDYLIPTMQLRAGLETSGETGFSLHRRAPAD